MMKKFLTLSLLILCGCVSQTVEQIQSDPENIQKANSVQKRVNAGMTATMNERRQDSEYLACVNKVKTLTALKSKESLLNNDMELILETKEWYEPRFCDIDHEYRNKALKQEIENFCWNKYWHDENWATTTALFPLRIINELVAIGTLGVVPTILGTCRANGRGWTSDDTTGFTEWCWKPGATWNYETCRKFVFGEKYTTGYYSNPDKYYWQYENDADAYIFDYDDIEELKEKMREYCKVPPRLNPQLNPHAKKLCQGDYTKGCLVNLDNRSVSTFGTRRDGVIVSFRLWGMELAINDQVFVYDNRDYYDGQGLKTDGYYYQYVGNYDDGIQKLPAFKRSQYKVFKEPDTAVEQWCK